MSEVIGPTSTMPGSGHHVPANAKCDLHPRRKAVARIQGETDSMGAELNDLCRECLDEHRAYTRARDTSGKCDWCRTQAEKRTQTRHYEEGLYGPLYMVCEPCKTRRDKRIAEELAEMDERYGPLDDGYDDRDWQD